eukprot:8560315-Pyramimonas_sp.AAC.1
MTSSKSLGCPPLGRNDRGLRRSRLASSTAPRDAPTASSSRHRAIVVVVVDVDIGIVLVVVRRAPVRHTPGRAKRDSFRAPGGDPPMCPHSSLHVIVGLPGP